MAARKRGAKTPGGYQQELQQALQFQRAGRLGDAEQTYLYVLSRQPRHLQANHLLGLLYFGAGQWANARQYLEKALRHHPGEAELHNNLGNVLRAAGDSGQALLCHSKATTLSPRSGRYLADLAWARSECGDSEGALRDFRKAAVLEPADAPIQVGIGNLLRDIGDIAGAETAFSRALELQPGWPEALLRLAQLHDYREGAHVEEVGDVERAWQSSAPDDPGRIDLGFARAQMARQRGAVSDAFDSLMQAHRLLARQEPFDREETRAYFALLRKAPLAEPLPVPEQGPRPLFVLGLPRSGSSLVEQVLTSHSRVEGAGELSEMGRICAELESESGGHFATAFADLDVSRRQQLAQRYRAVLSEYGADADWVVDKLPANFLAIGLLQSLFPDALIVHCQRDAAATCWSIYGTRFAQPHPFAHDLESLGFYHGLYSELMLHWEEAFPGRIFGLSYESLVADSGAVIPALLDRASLAMEAGCLAPHDNTRPVRTASAMQVRQPIYQDAVTGYRAFDQYLQPLYQSLALHGAAPRHYSGEPG